MLHVRLDDALRVALRDAVARDKTVTESDFVRVAIANEVRRRQMQAGTFAKKPTEGEMILEQLKNLNDIAHSGARSSRKVEALAVLIACEMGVKVAIGIAEGETN